MEKAQAFYRVGVRFYRDDSDYRDNGMSPKVYTYKVPSDVDVVVGDHCVVLVEGRAPALKVVRVVGSSRDTEKDVENNCLDDRSALALKWIVQKVDTSRFDALKANDLAAVNLINELEKRSKQRSLLAKFEGVATAEELENLKAFIGG